MNILTEETPEFYFNKLIIDPSTQYSLRGQGSNTSEFILSNLFFVESIIITEYCSSYISKVEFCNLPVLKTLKIGDNCFTPCRRTETTCVRSNDYGTKVVYARKQFLVTNCPMLERLTIGKGSLQDCFEFRLEKLPSLTSCEIGDFSEESFCFYYCSFVVFRSM